mmetsp:Transcript_9116/g.29538  ORF Transcript_9116/g.29538 Transcript_9116/m.29538 type:complete len:100 (-) Transcript_9116:158-457(-)|eukprot:CAMPEP_0118896256 /NCGR_PEP_ID=MMETSP1166-20130328/4214_1 /TAXON_ID=1104430 /ORGANISM="Chrysoreinhardia sp, Strain CCMP3193" /LENGTH=99 /DNA_ID=CAMNT_0006835309 /DNA_START=107 /DNA_END=406 /DNA_ORIENTATION=+
MRSETMEQELEMQDRNLDELSQSVGTLSRLGREIKSEIEDQNSMLNDLEDAVDQNLEGMSLITKKTTDLVNKAGGKRWCALIAGLSVVIVVLLYLIIAL